MNELIQLGSQYVTGAQGFYHLPAEQYHAAPGVSQSMLKQIARSPAHLQAYLHQERKTSPAMEFGTLVHTALFEPRQFGDGKSHYVRPKDLDGRTKEGKAWAESHSGLPIITFKDSLDLAGIQDSANSHHYGAGILGAQGVAEVSAFTGGMKARLDRIVRADDGNLYIIDAKTCNGDWSDASPVGFTRQIEKMGYHRQAAVYLDVCRELGVEIADFLWLAVEREAPYAVGVYKLAAEDIERGRQMYKRELEIYANCLRTGQWPGYSSDIVELTLRRGK